MSARIPIDDAERTRHVLGELARGVEVGRLRAVAVVAVDGSGGLEVWWGASRTLGPHAGSILRGAVAYLGARMDADALEGDAG